MYPNPLLNLNIFILSHVVKYIVLPCNDYVLVHDYVQYITQANLGR